MDCYAYSYYVVIKHTSPRKIFFLPRANVRKFRLLFSLLLIMFYCDWITLHTNGHSNRSFRIRSRLRHRSQRSSLRHVRLNRQPHYILL